MRIKFLVAMIIIVFSIGISVSILIINNKTIPKVNLVDINDVIHVAEKNWGQIRGDTFHTSDMEQPFSIINNEETVLYQTPGSDFSHLYEAIKNKDTIIDVKQHNEIVGKLIIRNNEQEIIQQLKSELVTFIVLLFALLLISSLLYAAYIYRVLLKPFQRLQIFAANVAKGHLDFPLHMDKNNYFGAFTESFDIMREELATARQKEYEANRSKKELVATLSHDIKTPVATIKAVSELLLVQANAKKILKQVNTIYSKADQINLLVTDMFHSTLEELQQLKLSITEQSSEVLVPMIEDVNYHHQIHYDPIPQCIILTDPVRMQQVIDNIISNSYKYAGTSISVQSQINEGYLELYIHDYGPGMREEELPLLFNKYYRGTNVEGKNGSGLGLYISKYFIENTLGQIDCYNRKDGFTVVLKIKLA
ncbi:signal transduction histidine kinase [Sporosarcina luteola]|nr:signal transduction histidine kinase [Sporosarcina luteola]